MKSKRLLLAVLLFISLCLVRVHSAGASQQSMKRWFSITLIPNFVDNSIEFDATLDLDEAADAPDLTGLPLQVERQWSNKEQTTWNILGHIQGGVIESDETHGMYHLKIGVLMLGPNDKVRFTLPFVNLDYSQIQPAPDAPDLKDEASRQRTHRFTYAGLGKAREIAMIDIPFSTISKKIDMFLTPLAGEAFVGKTKGFRLTGLAQFTSVYDFDEFSRLCQSTAGRLEHGDYRSEALLYTFDSPHYFGPDVRNAAFASKPTLLQLRSELTSCEYDQQKKIGRVEAAFSGRMVTSNQVMSPFPKSIADLDFPDGNYSFYPKDDDYKGVQGYEIRVGTIVLAPSDTLTIRVPHASIQADRLTPLPDDLLYVNDGRQMQIVYVGPASFELSLPYVPQSQFYVNQFPSLLRPGIAELEQRLPDYLPMDGSWPTWIMLALGLLILLISRFLTKSRWLSNMGWLLLVISLAYGIRGSFGLLCAAVTLHIVGFRRSADTTANERQRIILGSISFAVIAFAVYLDELGNSVFSGLSAPNLSPLTPVVLIGSVGTVFLLIFGHVKSVSAFSNTDLPIFALFLATLTLFDALDKSLLAFLLLFGGCFLIMQRAMRTPATGKSRNHTFGSQLQNRLKLAFGNRIVPVSILVLILFALVNDLSSTYANEMQLSLSPLLAPVLIPILALVSVFLTFTGIALLFVLVYPYIPSRVGYLKATFFALFLFLIFLFGIATDDRLIAALPTILVGRVLYYFSVPLLIGVYFDIDEYMQKENKRRAKEGAATERISFQTASGLYLRNLQGITSTLAGIVSLVVPSLYAFLSSQPVLVTYFSLLEKLILLPL